LTLRREGFVTYGDNNDKGDIGDQDSMIIKDVLLVEHLKHCLLSINKLCDKVYQVTFELELCLISDVVTIKTLLVGKKVNNVCIEYLLHHIKLGLFNF